MLTNTVLSAAYAVCNLSAFISAPTQKANNPRVRQEGPSYSEVIMKMTS